MCYKKNREEGGEGEEKKGGIMQAKKKERDRSIIRTRNRASQ
jgi:hypothetical protein